jgi:hypothetical protein
MASIEGAKQMTVPLAYKIAKGTPSFIDTG